MNSNAMTTMTAKTPQDNTRDDGPGLSHTPVEVERFGQVMAAGGWIDAMRCCIPPGEQLYTWWSYRSPDWAAADKGRRLDLTLAGPTNADNVDPWKIVSDSVQWR